MANKILEVIAEPSRIEVGSNFFIKVKVQKIRSEDLVTENLNLTVDDINNITVEKTNNLQVKDFSQETSVNIVTEDGEKIITEGDYYE